jgi:hypothetical protein
MVSVSLFCPWEVVKHFLLFLIIIIIVVVVHLSQVFLFPGTSLEPMVNPITQASSLR